MNKESCFASALVVLIVGTFSSVFAQSNAAQPPYGLVQLSVQQLNRLADEENLPIHWVDTNSDGRLEFGELVDSSISDPYTSKYYKWEGWVFTDEFRVLISGLWNLRN